MFRKLITTLATRCFTPFTTSVMASPTARAEARRKAILARGGARLAKLTTSARGEDAPAYLNDGERHRQCPLSTDSCRSHRCTRKRERRIPRGRDSHATTTAPAKGHAETVTITPRLCCSARSLGLVRRTTAPVHAGTHEQCPQSIPNPNPASATPTPAIRDPTCGR